MSEKTTELETIEVDKEAIIGGGALQVKRDSLEDTLWLADNIEKLIEANKKIFAVIMKSSYPGDFVAFGKGEKEKIEMVGAGCERVARDVGISFTNRTEKFETFEDEIGHGFRYIYEADAIFRGRIIRVMSIASSRTKFFGKDSGEYKDISEVSRDDVQIAAYRGVFKEGVKAMLGLRRLNRGELEKYGVKIITSGGYDFKNKDEKAAASETVAVTISDITFKRAEKWTKFSIKDEEGAVYNTFSETIAKTAKECKESGKVANITFHKDQYGLAIDSLVAV